MGIWSNGRPGAGGRDRMIYTSGGRIKRDGLALTDGAMALGYKGRPGQVMVRFVSFIFLFPCSARTDGTFFPSLKKGCHPLCPALLGTGPSHEVDSGCESDHLVLFWIGGRVFDLFIMSFLDLTGIYFHPHLVDWPVVRPVSIPP